MRTLNVLLIGAGERGLGIYTTYALNNPSKLKITHVVEPNKKRRDLCCEIHKINTLNSFQSLDEVNFQNIDFAINSTPDKIHFETTKLLLENRIITLLEKPISTDYNECLELEKLSKEKETPLIICHVLRYAPFYQKIKKLSQSIGRIIHIKQIEIISNAHFTHSYVRGKWNNIESSGPISLTKTCHDFDIITNFSNSTPVKVFSNSPKSKFSRDELKIKTPKYCLNNCPIINECAYSSKKIYKEYKKDWMLRDLSEIKNDQEIEFMLKNSKYGECVYKLNNNVPDSQFTTILFKNKITAEMIMITRDEESNRKIMIEGEKGKILGDLRKGTIKIKIENKLTTLNIGESNSHGGGDEKMLDNFIALFNSKELNKSDTTISKSLLSHKLAFDAELERKKSENAINNIFDAQ